ncbi:MAG: cation-translocating P-type ATPase [Bacteroidota bacterium]
METEEPATIELKIEGMTCTNCALGIQKYLDKQGLEDASVSFANGEVTFRPNAAIPIKQVVKGIQQLGYKVVQESTPAHHQEAAGKTFTIEHKLYISLFFTIPLLLHMGLDWHLLHQPIFQLLCSLPVFGIGVLHFGKSAFYSLKSGVPNMDVLIILGTTAAFIYSLVGTWLGLGENFLFYETAATIITLVLMGNWLEHRSVKKTTSAVEELVKLQHTKARLIQINPQTGQEELVEIKASQIQVGQYFLVNTGDTVPVDGEVSSGNARLNEAMISGESMPVDKAPGDRLIGGTIVEAGSLRMQATVVGKETLLAQIIDMVKTAQNRKPQLQNLADKISAIFVPAVVAIALLTFFISFYLVHMPFQASLLHSIAVLVIACPCAMGLAIPTAVVVGIGKAAQNGVLIKGADTLEKLSAIKTVVFDKTGTLTTGNFKLEKIALAGFQNLETRNDQLKRVKTLLYNLEKHSSHPIAKSVVNELQGFPDVSLTQVQEQKGIGMKATDSDGNVWEAGSYEMAKHLTNDNQHTIYLLENDQLRATFDLEDEAKPYACELVAFLKSQGIQSVLLSGDRKTRCDTLAKQVGIEVVYAEKKPDEKLRILEELSRQAPVAMVGDGINDAPALAKASVGISLSNATQVAVQAAQIVLLNGNLKNLERAFRVGQLTIKTIKQNLFWAFFYNVVAIPFAAAGFLSPAIAAFSMAFSDVVVIFNSLRLKWRR